MPLFRSTAAKERSVTQAYNLSGFTSRRRVVPPGFTVVELLVAIGVVVVLAAIAIVAIGRTGNTARERLTQTQLGNLKGMLADYEAATKLSNSPPVWPWWNGTGAIVNAPYNAQQNSYTVNFWKLPYRVDNQATNTPDPIANPGVVVSTSPDAVRHRNGAIAVVCTQLAMNLVGAVPANRTRLGQVPDNQKMFLEWQSGNIGVPAGDDFQATTDDIGPPPLTQPLTYCIGVPVRFQGRQYVATDAYTFGSNPQPVVNGSAPWHDVTDKGFQPVPILLDGWNNPIILVPASGIRVRLRNQKSSLVPGDATQNFIIVSPEGEVANNGTAAPNIVRVGRPFFASAGPDGDFNTGDDNLYSFQQ
jgi:type II secretory pathway pseudopilin PulG